MLVGSLALAVAPKCPLCLVAYFGVLGAAGTVSTAYGSWIAPLTAAWLAVTVGALAWRARGDHRPTIVAVAAAAAIVIGKFVVAQPSIVIGGVAALLTAAIWRAWPRPIPEAACGVCDECSSDNSARGIRARLWSRT